MSDFIKKVAAIQKNLKAPKSQRNKFGNYNYRNQEDILEAVKPLLGDLVLTVNDEIQEIGGRVYVKSTAKIADSEGHSISNSAYAREALEQKGMADAQLTGATSSYARKYALNGLFLIDDTKDADSDEVTAAARGEKVPVAAKKSEPAPKDSTPEVKMTQANPENKVNEVLKEISTAKTEVKKVTGLGSKKTTAATTKPAGDDY